MFGSLANNWNRLSDFIDRFKQDLGPAALVCLLVAYHAFLVVAGIRNFPKAAPLICTTLFCWSCFLASAFVSTRVFQENYQRWTKRTGDKLDQFWFSPLMFPSACLMLVAALLAVDTASDPARLRGLAGYGFFILLMFLTSTDKLKVKWRTVVCAFCLHILLAFVILRWSWGQWLFQKIATKIVRFLDYAQNGTKFVFGFIADPPNICNLSPVFLFTSLQTLIYFAAIVAVLFHFGVVQVVLVKLSWFMRVLLATSSIESFNAWACTFLGMTEAPLLVAPYLEKATVSELHAILTSGFACTSGTVFAAYISLGACPDYLLTSSLMSAPCSLGCAKLLLPEVETTDSEEVCLNIARGDEKGVLETLSSGAVAIVPVIFAIGANLVVVLGLLALLDDVIGYCGELLGYDGWTFPLIVGHIFYPVAYLMGVTESLEQTLIVAELMGTKTVVNEFVAYKNLGEFQTSGRITARSAMIATYALCGFANFGSTGIQMEVFGTLAPSTKPKVAKVMMRALCAGAIACFMNAAIAGVLVDEPIYCSVGGDNSTCFALPS